MAIASRTKKAEGGVQEVNSQWWNLHYTILFKTWVLPELFWHENVIPFCCLLMNKSFCLKDYTYWRWRTWSLQQRSDWISQRRRSVRRTWCPQWCPQSTTSRTGSWRLWWRSSTLEENRRKGCPEMFLRIKPVKLVIAANPEGHNSHRKGFFKSNLCCRSACSICWTCNISKGLGGHSFQRDGIASSSLLQWRLPAVYYPRWHRKDLLPWSCTSWAEKMGKLQNNCNNKSQILSLQSLF